MIVFSPDHINLEIFIADYHRHLRSLGFLRQVQLNLCVANRNQNKLSTAIKIQAGRGGKKQKSSTITEFSKLSNLLESVETA
jgi:hypothetical protein